MLANVHAIAVLATLVVPAMLFLYRPGYVTRPLRSWIGFAFAIAVIGLCCLLLLMYGVPIAEWLFPLFSMLLATLFVTSDRLFNLLRWGLLLSTVGLVLSALALRQHGFTSTPPALHEHLVKRTYLRSVGEELRNLYPDDREFSPAPVEEIIPNFERIRQPRVVFKRLWHSGFTRLYVETSTKDVVWYPGGPVAAGSQHLEWRTRNPS